MEDNLFNTLVKKYFDFLVSDYSFTIVEDSCKYGGTLFFNKVVFSSPSRKGDQRHKQTGVQVTLDRGYISVDIGPYDLDREKEEWLDISEIMRLIKPEIVVYDVDKADLSKSPQMIFEPPLIRLSGILQTYCDQFLQGDFSKYDQIMKARTEWREQYIKKINEKYKRN
jgi:hypothetical protein